VLLLTAPGAAQAHVRVLPETTASGSYSALTFRVPNESTTASTTRVSVQLPQDRPFLSVRSKPVPGWRASLTEQRLPRPVDADGTTITKAVRTVTWTAARGSGIGNGEYQEFSLSVGPLPQPGEVLLPVVQTYSDGSAVRWDQPTPASGTEPERPAPTLLVTAAVDPAPAGAGAPGGAASTTSTSVSRPDPVARWLGGAGLALAVIAVAVALAGVRRTRHPRTV
jgi:uncharacterized protein YcnI